MDTAPILMAAMSVRDGCSWLSTRSEVYHYLALASTGGARNRPPQAAPGGPGSRLQWGTPAGGDTRQAGSPKCSACQSRRKVSPAVTSFRERTNRLSHGVLAAMGSYLIVLFGGVVLHRALTLSIVWCSGRCAIIAPGHEGLRRVCPPAS